MTATSNPVAVAPGSSFQANASLTFTLPANWATLFSLVQATNVTGTLASFPVDATNATPATLNWVSSSGAQPLTSTPVTSGQPLTWTTAVTGGPYTATAAGSDITLALDQAAGFTPVSGEINVYAATGQGLFFNVQGVDSTGSLVLGPLIVACDPPAAPATFESILTNPAPTVTAPTVTKVMPATGSTFSLALISGTNLQNARSVQFGTKHAMFVPLTSNVVIALAPARSSSGPVNVTVTTTKGTSAVSAGDVFTYR